VSLEDGNSGRGSQKQTSRLRDLIGHGRAALVVIRKVHKCTWNRRSGVLVENEVHICT
jgi:hypothetical protein